MSLVLLGILNSQVSGAAAGSYDLLETQVLGTTASSVTFTGLGSYSDYKHLQIRLASRNARIVGGSERLGLRMNSDTGTNYSMHRLEGTGSTINSFNSSPSTRIYIGFNPRGAATDNEYGAAIVDILDFSSTNKYTTIRALGGGASTFDNRIVLNSGAWMNTNAVTSLTFTDDGGDNFTAGSRFSLYGVK